MTSPKARVILPDLFSGELAFAISNRSLRLKICGVNDSSHIEAGIDVDASENFCPQFHVMIVPVVLSLHLRRMKS